MENLQEELLVIIFKAKEGDGQAMEQLIDYFDVYVSQQIKNFCYRFDYGYGNQEDIYQDAMVSLIKCCKSFDVNSGNSFFPYAAKVIEHSIVSQCKNYNKRNRLTFVSINALDSKDTEFLNSFPSAQNVEQQVIRSLIIQEIKPHLKKASLNDFERHIIRSICSGETDPKAIASKANVTVYAYYKCTKRMRRKLLHIQKLYK